jgi:hypothetical protein
VLQPLQDHGGVETAGIGEYDLIDGGAGHAGFLNCTEAESIRASFAV